LEVVLEELLLVLDSGDGEGAAREANEVPEISVFEHAFHLIREDVLKSTVREYWRNESL
jgi:hypothetical protein